MVADIIDHSTLSRLVEASVLRDAHVLGQKGGWTVVTKYDMHERPLVAQRSGQVRIFRKFQTLVRHMRDIGIARFHVDTVDFDPAVPKSAKRHDRAGPGRAEAMRRVREAAAYDTWLRSEIEPRLCGVDDSTTKSVHNEQIGRVRPAAGQAGGDSR